LDILISKGNRAYDVGSSSYGKRISEMSNDKQEKKDNSNKQKSLIGMNKSFYLRQKNTVASLFWQVSAVG